MKTKFLFIMFAAVTALFVSCLNGQKAVEKPGVKFHPGHYVAVGPGTGLAEIRQLDEPALAGVNKRYFWRTLEPEPGRYDFSEIEADLAYCEARGKRLIVFLMDKTFSRRSPLPLHLAGYEFDSEYDGMTPARWHPFYMERLLALGKALGEKFDARPLFEGLAVQESSLGITEEGRVKFGYTPEKYRDALIAILSGLKQSLPESRVFWYSNFLPGNNGYLHDIADAIEGTGIFMGGPDILPHRRGIKKTSYPMYEKFRDRLTLFCSAQGDSYKHHKNDVSNDEDEPIHPEGYLTMEAIFLFARDSLHVRYLFWDYEYEITTAGQRTFDDALEVIRRHPRFNAGVGPASMENTACMILVKPHPIMGKLTHLPLRRIE